MNSVTENPTNVHTEFSTNGAGAALGKFDPYAHAEVTAVERPTVATEPASNNQAQPKGKAKTGATWVDYVDTAIELGYKFRLNDLDDTVEANGQRMDDVIEAGLLSRLHEKGFRSAEVARRAFITAAAQNRYHPVKQYLETFNWDGRDHIAALARYFTDAHDLISYRDGTQCTVIHAWLHRWLIGSVAKIYEPRNAQNPMLILDGAQGRGKSFFVKWLCPLPELHFEGAIRPEDKDYLGYHVTRWVWEVSELGATIRKADREALKSFITQQDVTYRPPFGRYAICKPALASFIGTVNFEGALLHDPTGHRRFWPVTLTDLDWNYTKNISVAQLWAQACALYHRGESWRLSDEEKQMHAAIAELYEAEDVLEGYVREIFDIGDGSAFTHTTTIIDKLRIYRSLKGSERAVSMQLAATLTKMGLQKRKKDNRWGYEGLSVKPEFQSSNRSN